MRRISGQALAYSINSALVDLVDFSGTKINLKDSSHADEHPERSDEPPKPNILIGGEVGRVFDNNGPLGKRKAKSSQSTVPEKRGFQFIHFRQQVLRYST